MPFGIRIISFSKKYKEADYEPELHPGVTYKLYNPKATLKIFSTGGVTITARSVNDVQSAVERIFPLVYEFRKPRTAADEEALRQKRAARGGYTQAESARPCERSMPRNTCVELATSGGGGERAGELHLVTMSDDDADAWE